LISSNIADCFGQRKQEIIEVKRLQPHQGNKYAAKFRLDLNYR
jgi:hypothetical protein